jgi:hypothetical protein
MCTPVTHNASKPDGGQYLDGEYSFVNISKDDVDKYKDAFENEVVGMGGAAFKVNQWVAGLGMAAVVAGIML